MNPYAWVVLMSLVVLQPPTQAVEPTARCSLSFQQGRETSFTYRTRAWDQAAVDRARADAGVRARMNQLLPLQLPLDLSLPMTLRIGERTLEAGTHRLGLAMDEGGAWQLRLLVEGNWQPLPWTLTDCRPAAATLSFTLVPAEDGLLALEMRWGGEFGRLLLRSGQ